MATNLPTGGARLRVSTSVTRTTSHTISTATTSTPAKPKVKPHHPAKPASAGTYQVATSSLTLQEPSTKKAATGKTASGEWIRTLPVSLVYPKSTTKTSSVQGAPAPDYKAGPFPLVIFSQGFNMLVSAYSQLLNAWASAGYVVAAPTYPRTDPGPNINENDLLYHPADLRFVISSLTTASEQQGNLLHKLVNSAEVGIIGHSDGGDVSLAVAANSAYRDSAVKAAVILSGAEWEPFGGIYYSGSSVPVPLLVAQGDADTVNVLSCSGQLYDQAPQPKYYLDIPNAGHAQPYLDPGPWRDGVVQSVVAFLNAYLRNSPSTLNGLLGKTLSGGETLTNPMTVPGEPNTGCPQAPTSP